MSPHLVSAGCPCLLLCHPFLCLKYCFSDSDRDFPQSVSSLPLLCVLSDRKCLCSVCVFCPTIVLLVFHPTCVICFPCLLECPQFLIFVFFLYGRHLIPLVSFHFIFLDVHSLLHSNKATTSTLNLCHICLWFSSKEPPKVRPVPQCLCSEIKPRIKSWPFLLGRGKTWKVHRSPDRPL